MTDLLEDLAAIDYAKAAGLPLSFTCDQCLETVATVDDTGICAGCAGTWQRVEVLS